MHAPGTASVRRQRITKLFAALAIAFGMIVAAPLAAQAAAEIPADALFSEPYCTDDGRGWRDVDVQIDPAYYPAGTFVSVAANFEGYILLYHAYTDETGHAEIRVGMSKTVSVVLTVEFQSGVDAEGFPIFQEIGGNIVGSFDCSAPPPPPPPPAPVEVCVLETGSGWATVDYGRFQHTFRFSPSITVPKVCVTEAEARGWIAKLEAH